MLNEPEYQVEEQASVNVEVVKAYDDKPPSLSKEGESASFNDRAEQADYFPIQQT